MFARTIKKVVVDEIVNVDDKQNHEARTEEFACETERLMIQQFSFRYLLCTNLLKYNNDFRYIIDAIELEKTLANSKKKRGSSAKRP